MGLWARPPRPPRARYQHTAAFPSQLRRRSGGCSHAWGREARAAAPHPQQAYVYPASPCVRRQARAARRTHTPPPHKQTSAAEARGPPSAVGAAARSTREQNTGAMALPTYGAVPKQEIPQQQINWRRRLRRAAVCAGAGLMVSRALVNQGGTVVDEVTTAASLHIREDELDDRMTEDCNMSDGRSTFIEWVQYLMGYAAEVTPAAGAVLLDRGQFPDELYRTLDLLLT